MQEMTSSKVKKLDEVIYFLKALDDEISSKREYVAFLREVSVSLVRTQELCIIQGWVLESAVKELESRVDKVTFKVYYLKVEDPLKDDLVPVVLGRMDGC